LITAKTVAKIGVVSDTAGKGCVARRLTDMPTGLMTALSRDLLITSSVASAGRCR
jgi:hypothetical protein